MEGSGLSFEGLLVPQLQHPVELTLDLVLRQLLRRHVVEIHRAQVHPHRPAPLRQWGDPMAEEGVEHPQPVKAMLHQLLEFCLDDLQLVLPTGGTLRPALPPLQPSFGERREWQLRWVPNVEPLPMPPLIIVAGGVRGVGARWPRLLLQGEAPNRRGPR